MQDITDARNFLYDFTLGSRKKIIYCSLHLHEENDILLPSHMRSSDPLPCPRFFSFLRVRTARTTLPSQSNLSSAHCSTCLSASTIQGHWPCIYIPFLSLSSGFWFFFFFIFLSIEDSFLLANKTKYLLSPELSLDTTWPISCCPLFYSPLEQNSVKSYPYSLSPSLLPLALHHATQTSPQHPSEDYACHS